MSNLRTLIAFLGLVLVLTLSASGQTTISLGLSGPGAVNDSTITVGQVFSVDIYWENKEVDLQGFTTGFRIFSPTIKTIIHVPDRGNGINDLGDLSAYSDWRGTKTWDFTGLKTIETDWDGILPDTIGFGGLNVKVKYGPHKKKKVLSWSMIVPQAGEIVVDSAYFRPGGIWAIADSEGKEIPPLWQGPYRFTVVSREEIVPHETAKREDIVAQEATLRTEYAVRLAESDEETKNIIRDRKAKLEILLGTWNFGFEAGLGLQTPTLSGFSASYIVSAGMQALATDRLFSKQSEIPGIILNMRVRINKRMLTHKTLVFVGIDRYDIWRNTKTQDALDCLYCPNLFERIDMPANYYIETGISHKFNGVRTALDASVLLRISDNSGFYSASGDDPYGVAGSINRGWVVDADYFVLALSASFMLPI